MSLETISDYDLGWVVGMIEGEGTFVVKERQVNIRVSQIEADRLNLEKLMNVLGMGYINGPYQYADHPRNPMLMWTVGDYVNCYKLLTRIYSLLSPRRQAQASQAIEFLKGKKKVYEISD